MQLLLFSKDGLNIKYSSKADKQLNKKTKQNKLCWTSYSFHWPVE